MITRLETYHELRAIPVIRAFALETSRYFGANEGEARQVELAAEEASAFIINAFHPEANELFEIECEADGTSGLIFRFRNRGIPVDEENLPVYDSRNPNDSLEGLPLFLLEKMTDSVCLKNEGSRGWVLLFQKQIQELKRADVSEKQAEDEEALLARCAKERLTVGLAEPSDAYGIVKLTYQTYRYSYAKSIFYYPEMLKQAIADGSVIVFVAKNEQGEVVVNSAYLRAPSCREMVEAGMLMSAPEYRKNRSLLKLSREQSRFVKSAESGVRVAFANLVTAHDRSQKLVKAYGFVPTAIKLSVHDQAEFIGIESAEKRRESLLYAIMAPHGVDDSVLYLPAMHHEVTAALLQDFDNVRLDAKSQPADAEHTELTIHPIEAEQRAELVFESMGKDWFERLRIAVRELEADGCITFHLRLPADRPLPDELESKLRKLRFFFSGILLKTLDQWELLYTALYAQRFDFGHMVLADERGQKLLAEIRSSYENLEKSL
jgi:anti-sigma regulatory factor (Ser/Thr protein kinase)